MEVKRWQEEHQNVTALEEVDAPIVDAVVAALLEVKEGEEIEHKQKRNII